MPLAVVWLRTSDGVQAHAETYTGLVEAGVGVILDGAGVRNWCGATTAIPKCPRGPCPQLPRHLIIFPPPKSPPAQQEAQEMLILNDKSGISFNRARLLALSMAVHECWLA